MKDFQAELWNRLTSDLEDFSAGYDLFQTPRMSEVERIYEEMRDKFMATLPENQRRALHGLLEIAQTMRWDAQEAGTVLGLRIAKELRDFLDYPAEALYRASAKYTPVAEAEKFNINALESFFKEAGHGHS